MSQVIQNPNFLVNDLKLTIWNIDYYDKNEEEDDIDDYYWFAESFFTNHDILRSYCW
jgi:hypothetical protein